MTVLTLLAPISQNGQTNTLKQFVGNLPMNCLSVFNHFMGLAVEGLMFPWLSFKLLYKRSYQRRGAQSVMYIGQYSKQRIRITSFDLIQDKKIKNLYILRFHVLQSALLKEAINYLFHRTLCTQASIAKRKCTIPFFIKFSNISLENDNLFIFMTLH